MKKGGGFVYIIGNILLLKSVLTEGSLPAVFPQLFFIEITNSFYHLMGEKKKIITHERTVTMDYIQHRERRVTGVASIGPHCRVLWRTRLIQEALECESLESQDRARVLDGGGEGGV